MSVVQVSRRKEQSANLGEKTRDDREEWLVISDVDNETRSNVLQAVYDAAVPPNGMVVNTIDATQQNPLRLWYASVSYKLPDEGERQDPDNSPQQPELEAPTLRVWGETKDIAVAKGWYKNDAGDWVEQALRNAAHMRWPEPLHGQHSLINIELTRNEPEDTLVIDRLQTWRGAIADDEVFGIVPSDKRRVRIVDIVYEKVFRLSRVTDEITDYQTFWRTTYTFQIFSPDLDRLVHVGSHYLDNFGKLQPFNGFIGFLDLNGGPLNGDGTANGPDEPVMYKIIFPDKPKLFAPLNLPADLDDIQAVIFVR